ncbi:MAG: hypothetical protein U0L84_04185 [Acutalibacteraceae bacterium]|nr:hypothetical protein [Acutalibacteraceae bacterium]
MADYNENGCFKEAVCIDAGRVYDSCCDRDCLEDLRVYFTADAQSVVNEAISVRLKAAEVLTVAINVEPVSFNRGYYSCDLTFYFLLTFDVTTAPHTCPTQINGICCFNKKVILFGSDGSVKTFSSIVNPDDDSCTPTVRTSSNMPKCVVQSVDPIPLSAKLGKVRDSYTVDSCIPSAVNKYVGGNLHTNCECGTPTVYVTLGLFTIVQLIRNVQMLIPVYDFCVPEKQCDDTTDQPCDVFRKIKFPTDDFFPPHPRTPHDDFGCGCTENE